MYRILTPPFSRNRLSGPLDQCLLSFSHYLFIQSSIGHIVSPSCFFFKNRVGSYHETNKTSQVITKNLFSPYVPLPSLLYQGLERMERSTISKYKFFEPLILNTSFDFRCGPHWGLKIQTLVS